MMDAATVMWHVLQRVWPTLGVGAVASPFVVWYVKWRIEHTHDERLEEWRAEVKKKADIELIHVRAALDETAARRQALTSGLTQRRFDAIAAIIGPFRRAHRAVQTYVRVYGEVGGGVRKADYEAVLTAQASLLDVLGKQSIFLSASTAAQVEAIRRLCEKATRLFLHFVDVAHDMPSGSDVDTWMQVTQQIEEDAPLAILALERDLRALMGDEDSTHVSKMAQARPQQTK